MIFPKSKSHWIWVKNGRFYTYHFHKRYQIKQSSEVLHLVIQEGLLLICSRFILVEQFVSWSYLMSSSVITGPVPNGFLRAFLSTLYASMPTGILVFLFLLFGVDFHPSLYDGALVWVPQTFLFEWLLSVKKKTINLHLPHKHMCTWYGLK